MEQGVYMSVTDIAELFGITTQAVYKQIRRKENLLDGHTVKRGGKLLIEKSAVFAMYGIKEQPAETGENQTFSTYKTDIYNQNNQETKQNQQEQLVQNQQEQLVANYINHLLQQIEDQKEQIERLSNTVQEKEQTIKDQYGKICELSESLANIAEKALATASRQQYLSVLDKQEIQTEEQEQETIYQENNEQKEKQGVIAKLASIFRTK